MKKERPISFDGDMVRAILNGTKTQARLAMKPQPEFTKHYEWNNKVLHDQQYRVWCWKEFVGDDLWSDIHYQLGHACPHGRADDYLWVRESWRPVLNDLGAKMIQYRSGGEKYVDDLKESTEILFPKSPKKWLQISHQPRFASRIELLILKTRIERLHAITKKDAIAEGIESNSYGDYRNYRADFHGDIHDLCTPLESFKSLWVSLHGQESWDENPWVWVIDFKRVDASTNEFESNRANTAASK